MAAAKWTAGNLPELGGKLAVITGGNSGIGFEAARLLLGKGAHVVIACRDPERGQDALRRLREAEPGGKIELMTLDLADLSSVRRFAGEFLERHGALHALCNNAGVMAIPLRRTVDGFEMQFGTNHLGHFALTALLLPALRRTEGARVVNVSSLAHRMGRIRLEDPSWEQGYSKWPAYGQSKLANLLFTYELQRRLEQAGCGVLSLACHPGYSDTNLQRVGPEMTGSGLKARVVGLGNQWMAQSAEMGALPTVYAAFEPSAVGGSCIVPGGMMQSRGYPRPGSTSARSRDSELAAALWHLSEQLTGVDYALPAPAAEARDAVSGVP